jgi:general secretion pathway protein E
MSSLPDLQSLDSRVASRLPYQFARRHGVIGVREQNGVLEVWARSGVTSTALAELQRAFGRRIDVRELDSQAFDSALNFAYERSLDSPAGQIVDGLDSAAGLDLDVLAHSLPTADLLENEDGAPIVRLINALFAQALRENASDIHIEPFEARSVVRFRVDGMLRDIVEPPRALHGVIVSRVKVMAQLDIAEKRLPQDGRIALRLAGRPVDVRVSTLPTGHGERVVLRLLDKQAGRLTLTALGMSAPTLAELQQLIRQPHGILLVTGPTGSGKTTTLYAALGQLDTRHQNIVTVEDPIEYDLDGVGQTQVNSRIGLGFAQALRSILRQDPDVIMIGEIRDLETAQIAVQASLTGHLVLATLHTNDAASAVTRLVDMGVEPFLLASSLIGALAQRLVRRLCPECRALHVPDAGERRLLDLDAAAATQVYSPAGCAQCLHSGYRGRTGIYELLTLDDSLRSLIHDGAPDAALRDHARAHGMMELREDGLRWVREGVTSMEEVLRVTRD